jgi:hypothetical protein
MQPLLGFSLRCGEETSGRRSFASESAPSRAMITYCHASILSSPRSFVRRSLRDYVASLPHGPVPDSWCDVEPRPSAIRRRRSVRGSTRKTDEVALRREHHRSQDNDRSKDAMKTLFTGCVLCGALTTNVEGYCPDCEAARSARRRERRTGQTRVLAAKVRRSSSAHR